MTDFDPATANKDEVLAKLEEADEAETARIVAAEAAGKKRKSVLEAGGYDADSRTDASGRVLYPWEPDPGTDSQPDPEPAETSAEPEPPTPETA